jgi:hypothetical protein
VFVNLVLQTNSYVDLLPQSTANRSWSMCVVRPRTRWLLGSTSVRFGSCCRKTPLDEDLCATVVGEAADSGAVSKVCPVCRARVMSDLEPGGTDQLQHAGLGGP